MYNLNTKKRMNNQDICRFLMSFLYEIDLRIIDVNVEYNGEYYITKYKSVVSGEIIDSKIKFIDDKIIWGNLNGRWRDDNRDSVITYKIYGNKVKIKETFVSGKKLVKEFN